MAGEGAAAAGIKVPAGPRAKADAGNARQAQEVLGARAARVVDGREKSPQAEDAGTQGPAPTADAVPDRQEGADQAVTVPAVVAAA